MINVENIESKSDDNRAKEGAKSSGFEKTSPKAWLELQGIMLWKSSIHVSL